MARPLRIDFEGAFHHVTNRGARRQDIFRCDEDRLDLLDLIGRAHQRFGIRIHSFCFMNNHIHVIVETPEAGLSKALHLIESSYVQKFNRRHEIDGPLLKGRFYSRLIQEDDYLRRALAYVERNPLDAGMVDDLEDYPWSSYRLFLNRGTAPEWLSNEGFRMSGVRTAAQLRKLVNSTNPKDTIDLAQFPSVIGSDDFIAAALAHAEANDEVVGHIRSSMIRPSSAEIEAAVSSVFSVPRRALTERTQGLQQLARTAAVGLSQELAGMSLAAIASRYQFSTAKSAGVIASRYRKRLREDQVFALRVEQVRQLLLDGRSGALGKAC